MLKTSPKVRKDGYRAITQVSRELKKLVKRNADVLVQLLQSGEPPFVLSPGCREKRKFCDTATLSGVGATLGREWTDGVIR